MATTTDTSVWGYKITAPPSVTATGIVVTFEVDQDNKVVETRTMNFRPDASEAAIRRKITKYVLGKRNNALDLSIVADKITVVVAKDA